MKTLIGMTIDILAVAISVYLGLFLFMLTFGKKLYTICLMNYHLNANYYASMQGREPEDILAEAELSMDEPENNQEDPVDDSDEEPGARFE